MHIILRIKFVMNDISKNADKNSEQIRIPNRILGADGFNLDAKSACYE